MRATVGAVWREIQRRLTDTGLDPAPREAQELVQHVLGWDGLRLLRGEDEDFPKEHMARLKALTARRLGGEPLAYVLGGAWFAGRFWQVGPGVLIPRPDSEILLNVVVDRAPPCAAVAEVGTGSGALLGSLLLEREDVAGVGVDIDPACVLTAGHNWQRHGLGTRATAVTGNLLEPVAGPVDVVMSNPPYIGEDEWAALEPGVRDFEPRLALVGGKDGLGLYRDLVPQAAEKLRGGGWLAVEIGWQQAEAVRHLLDEATCWHNVETLQDLAGRDRVVLACRK